MSRPQTYRTEAVVLHRVRTGEADRIVTLFTPYHGKLRAVARGVLRPTSHLSGHLEPFSRCALLVARARNLDIVTQAETLHSFPEIRNDLARSAAALCAFELLDRVFEDGQEGRSAYALLLSFLHWCGVATEPELPLRYFELRLLGLSGFGPELYECVACRRPIEPETNGFSARAGGVLCPDCVAGDAFARPVSVNALKVMRLFLRGDIEEAGRIHVERPLARELENLMRFYLPAVTERELMAPAFVDHVRIAGRFERRAPAPPAVTSVPDGPS